MKLSENMLNFLGYLYESPNTFAGKELCVGLAYPFGIASAVKNGLIEEHTHVLEAPLDPLRICPGVPYGMHYYGYRLTEFGKEIGLIGASMRRSKSSKTAYVMAAQAEINKRNALQNSQLRNKKLR